MRGEAAILLERAFAISQQLLAAADRGDAEAVGRLDAERRQLLQSVRASGQLLDVKDRLLLQELALLNDKAIGHLEHHRRIKGRQIDTAVVGRRAMHAYTHTQGSR
jgi:hypothetical protein